MVEREQEIVTTKNRQRNEWMSSMYLAALTRASCLIHNHSITLRWGRPLGISAVIQHRERIDTLSVGVGSHFGQKPKMGYKQVANIPKNAERSKSTCLSGIDSWPCIRNSWSHHIYPLLKLGSWLKNDQHVTIPVIYPQEMAARLQRTNRLCLSLLSCFSLATF